MSQIRVASDTCAPRHPCGRTALLYCAFACRTQSCIVAGVILMPRCSAGPVQPAAMLRPASLWVLWRTGGKGTSELEAQFTSSQRDWLQMKFSGWERPFASTSIHARTIPDHSDGDARLASARRDIGQSDRIHRSNLEPGRLCSRVSTLGPLVD